MWTYKYYAIVSSLQDEESIITGVNNYLATLHRTTDKTTDKELLDGRLPFVYNYFYWNLNRETGTWFEIFPNVDTKEHLFYPEKPEYNWILHSIFHDDQSNYDHQKAQNFIDAVLESTGKGFVLIKEERK